MRISAFVVASTTVLSSLPLAAAADEPDPWSTDGPPVPGLELVEARGPDGTPFAGEAFFAESPDQLTGSREGGTAWRCEVDPGDGTAPGGYWRAKPWYSSAPCALAHTYAEPGRYTITMTVTDPSGRSEVTTRELDVVPRPTTTRTGLTEGDEVALPAATSGGTWRATVPGETNPWSSDPRCEVVQPEGRRPGSARCFDEGEFRLHLDATDGAESRALVLVQENGAPSPLPATLWTLDEWGDPVREVRGAVRTGDRLGVTVQLRDPGVAPRNSDAAGDTLSCTLDLGDGVSTPWSEAYLGTCYAGHAWQRAGTYDLLAEAADDDGAYGSSSRSVRVVYRPVWLLADGVLDDGSVLAAHGGLTRDGTTGSFSLDTADGQQVRASGPVRLEVWSFQVTLEVPVTVDGVGGYRASVAISREDGALRVSVWQPYGPGGSVVSAGGADVTTDSSVGRAAARDLRRFRRTG